MSDTLSPVALQATVKPNIQNQPTIPTLNATRDLKLSLDYPLKLVVPMSPGSASDFMESARLDAGLHIPSPLRMAGEDHLTFEILFREREDLQAFLRNIQTAKFRFEDPLQVTNIGIQANEICVLRDKVLKLAGLVQGQAEGQSR